MEFSVIDIKTGKYPDVQKIALEEDWAKHLVYCDIDGFYIGEDGELILVDDCGNSAVCDRNRFEITTKHETQNAALVAMLRRVEWKWEYNGLLRCLECGNFQYQGHAKSCELAKLIAETEAADER